MNAFTAAAAALLSRYSENLLRDECEAALSGNLAGAVTSSSGLTNTAILLINSFKEEGQFFANFVIEKHIFFRLKSSWPTPCQRFYCSTNKGFANFRAFS